MNSRPVLTVAVLTSTVAAAAPTFARSPANPSTPTSAREVMKAGAPVAMSAVARLEAPRGRPSTDAQLHDARGTAAFRDEYDIAAASVCVDPGQARVALCHDRATRPAR